MRLLICTQAVDRDDPVLGFFHRWIEKLAEDYEKVIVICLREGDHTLPHNVEVLSLGKEKGVGRVSNATRFLKLIFSRKRGYDAVLVHMNQEYILLGGWLWKLLGKQVYLWRNHYAGNILTDLTALFCTKIFCTSKFSYTAKYKKTVLMPVGVDTDVFKPMQSVQREPRSVLFFGRLAPSKRPEMLLEALGALHMRAVLYTATFRGPGDASYVDGLKRRSQELGIAERVRFLPGIPNTEAPYLFNGHDIFVNLSPSGMLDKTIFEAMACGCLVLVASEDLRQTLDARSVAGPSIEDALEVLLSLPPEEKKRIIVRQQQTVIDNSLDTLRKRIVEEVTI